MSETMHIENMFTGQTSMLRPNQTLVKYTNASGIPTWIGTTTNSIYGSSTSPYYTSQIPNVQYANEIQIGKNVKTIGQYAFRGCNSLINITIPSSVTSIGGSAFRYCSGLTNVAIPDSVTRIEDLAFDGCSSLSGVYITDLGKWCEIIFYGASSPNPLFIGHNLYLNNQLISSLVIPNSITTIKRLTFSGCTSITNVTIHGNVTDIGAGAFWECTNLTSVNIGNGVRSIGEWAFRTCSSLTSLTIPDSVEIIVNGAIGTCGNLQKITFGNGLTTLQDNVFWGSGKCKIFDFRKSISVPSLGGTNAFGSTPSDREIIVPDNLYDDWVSATNWSSTDNNIVNTIVRASESSLGQLT